jgi:hypothetical protein|tara:strand:- start:41 stop:706 length:666 start_codon:yes stop_codon:yes gene_type:complete
MIGRAVHNLATNVIAPEARQFYNNYIAPHYVPGTQNVYGNLTAKQAFRNAVNSPLSINNPINQGLFSLIKKGGNSLLDFLGMQVKDPYTLNADERKLARHGGYKRANDNFYGMAPPSYDYRNYIANRAGHTANMRNMGLDPKSPPPQNSGLISDFDILNRMMDSVPSHPKAPRYSTFSPDVYGSKLMEEDLGMNEQGQYTQDEHDIMYNYAQMMRNQQGGG